jgi:hypothetical protein
MLTPSLVIRPGSKPTLVELQDCFIYSTGLSDGARFPCIWAGGKCAWYEITPSVRYRKIYRIMCDAVSLYWSIHDIYNPEEGETSGKKKRKKKVIEYGMPLDKLFLKVCRPLQISIVPTRC